MFCACVVANAAFYYALLKDLSRGHNNSTSQMTPLAVRRSTRWTAQASEARKPQELQIEVELDSFHLSNSQQEFG